MDVKYEGYYITLVTEERALVHVDHVGNKQALNNDRIMSSVNFEKKRTL